MTTALTKPSRHRRTLATYDQAAAHAAITSLETAIGGRRPLIDALLHAPPTDALAYVIGLIADPRNDARGLATLCADGQITVGELIEAYKQGAMARAQVAAIHAIAAHTPAVIEDVMVRAAPHTIACPACRGEGVTRPKARKGGDADDLPPVPCEGCRGTGQQYVSPDLERQKFAADLAGLTPKKGAPLIDLSDRRSLNLTAPKPGELGGFAALIAGADRVLYNADAQTRADAPADIVEGEVTTDPSPAPTEETPPVWTPPPGRRRTTP